MTLDELDIILDNNRHIDWAEDEDAFYFRNSQLDYYINNPDNSLQIHKWKLAQLPADQLIPEINKGLEVEQMTRVTGYFAKIGSWNPGKMGELRDRHRDDLK